MFDGAVAVGNALTSDGELFTGSDECGSCLVGVLCGRECGEQEAGNGTQFVNMFFCAIEPFSCEREHGTCPLTVSCHGSLSRVVEQLSALGACLCQLITCLS